MALPSGLKFKDRIALSPDGGYWFQCQKRHRVRKFFRHKADAVAFRAAHDATEHTSLLHQLGIQRIGEHRLGDAARSRLAQLEEMERHGKRDPKTLKYYRDCFGWLVRFFGDAATLENITQEEINRYPSWRASVSASQGERIRKDLRALAMLYRKNRISRKWDIPFEDIRPERRSKRVYTPAEIRTFVAALPEGSVERVFVYLKIRTYLRNEELYNLRVENVDVENRELHFILRNKSPFGTPKFHVQPVTDDVIEEVKPYLAGKGPRDYVMTLRGRKLGESSLRKRLLAASRRMNEARVAAGLPTLPAITALKDLRTTGITLATGVTGNIKAVSEFVGHESVTTTELYKVLTPAEREAMRRIAEASAASLPLD
jgi:integrase